MATESYDHGPQIYSSYEKALVRVDHLRATHGVWPGIVNLGCSHKGCLTRTCRHYDEHRWTLTWDPGDKLPH